MHLLSRTTPVKPPLVGLKYISQVEEADTYFFDSSFMPASFLQRVLLLIFAWRVYTSYHIV